jgi:predicted dehydrogenase
VASSLGARPSIPYNRPLGRYARYEDVLADPDVDFVHINSPIPDHAWMSIAASRRAST